VNTKTWELSLPVRSVTAKRSPLGDQWIVMDRSNDKNGVALEYLSSAKSN
jgi:hypothetical protein